MELYIAKMVTAINQFKKRPSSRIRELNINKKDERQFAVFPELPIELRFKIWAFCYLLSQPPRIVEVRTRDHDNCPSHEGFCPRYSPTRKHPLVNTCHESRAVARSEALKAGHLIFSSQSSPSSTFPRGDIIIFNPLSDLLYLPAEHLPLPLTRGPLGTYTQYKKSPPPVSPLSLRFLAISLERYGNQFNPMSCAIHDFSNLEYLLFVAKDWRQANQVCGLEENLKVMHQAWERRQLETWRFLSTGEEREREREGEGVGKRKWPKVRVVVRCEGARLEIAKGS
jgi:hypothetical protein